MHVKFSWNKLSNTKIGSLQIGLSGFIINFLAFCSPISLVEEVERHLVSFRVLRLVQSVTDESPELLRAGFLQSLEVQRLRVVHLHQNEADTAMGMLRPFRQFTVQQTR